MEVTPYRHQQRFGAMWLLLPLPALLLGLSMLSRGDRTLLVAVASALAVCAVGLVGLGRLVIEVHDDRLAWRFGYLGWPHWQLPLADIGLLQCVRVSALRGAGIRGIGKDRLFSVAIGGPALRITTRDGRVVTLGTPEPERLQAAIEARRQAHR